MTQSDKLAPVTIAKFSLKPILQPFHIKTMAFTSNIDGQHIMLIPHLQCPKHWHVLGSVRCPEHEYCAKTDVCSACVEEANND